MVSAAVDPRCTVSVIVPTRDRVRWLGEALDSIRVVAARLGERAALDVLVVDDGSDPATEDLATVFGARYLRADGRGVSAARNTGLRAATGDVVAFLDDDDVWTEQQLAGQLDLLEADASLGAVFGQSVEADAELRPLGEPAPEGPLPAGDALQFLSERVIQIGTLVVRRSVALAVGPFDEDLGLVRRLGLGAAARQRPPRRRHRGAGLPGPAAPRSVGSRPRGLVDAPPP